MGQSIDIGQAYMPKRLRMGTTWDDDIDAEEGPYVEVVRKYDAPMPAFADSIEGHKLWQENTNHPSYGHWSDICRETHLEEECPSLFTVPVEISDKHQQLIGEGSYPPHGFILLTTKSLQEVQTCRQNYLTRIAGWDNEDLTADDIHLKQKSEYYLEWLDYWIDHALNTYETPVIHWH